MPVQPGTEAGESSVEARRVVEGRIALRKARELCSESRAEPLHVANLGFVFGLGVATAFGVTEPPEGWVFWFVQFGVPAVLVAFGVWTANVRAQGQLRLERRIEEEEWATIEVQSPSFAPCRVAFDEGTLLSRLRGHPHGRYTLAVVAGLVAFALSMALFGHGGHFRIHWLGALLYTLGGPTLLSLFLGIVAGGLTLLFVEDDKTRSANSAGEPDQVRSNSQAVGAGGATVEGGNPFKGLRFNDWIPSALTVLFVGSFLFLMVGGFGNGRKAPNESSPELAIADGLTPEVVQSLKDSMRTALPEEGATRPLPRPQFGARQINERAAYLRWLGSTSERLKTHVTEMRTRIEFLETVWYEARRAGLEPSLVLGLVQVKSNFRPDTVGPAGEQGFMQVSPGWAKVVGITGASQLLNWQANLRAGCLRLRHLLDHHGGNTYLAINAYQDASGDTGVATAVIEARQRWLTPEE